MKHYTSLLQAAADDSPGVFNKLLNDWEAGQAQLKLVAECMIEEQERFGVHPGDAHVDIQRDETPPSRFSPRDNPYR
jgi:hypothetical protein